MPDFQLFRDFNFINGPSLWLTWVNINPYNLAFWSNINFKDLNFMNGSHPRNLQNLHTSKNQLPYGMKILHGIKFYSFTVGDTTVKLKSMNFYSIKSSMSLLKIQCGSWPMMTPDLRKATVYGSEILSSSLPQLNSSIHNWCLQMNTAFQFKIIIRNRSHSTLSPRVKCSLT